MAFTTGAHRSGSGGRDAAEPRRWLLAIDTATEQAGVALFDGSRLADVSWPGGRQHTTSVLPAIDSLLRMADIDLDCVGCVAVATGPGSFTGLRVGLSLAKGFAITGDRDLIGVPTLDIAVSPYLAAGIPCIALVPAGRARVVWSIHSAPGEASPPVNTSFEDFLKVMPQHPSHFVAGELTPTQRVTLAEFHGNIVTPAMSLRRPAMLAELGYRRWLNRDVDEPVTLEPLYLHGQPNPG